jgi:hypothetical protein
MPKVWKTKYASSRTEVGVTPAALHAACEDLKITASIWVQSDAQYLIDLPQLSGIPSSHIPFRQVEGLIASHTHLVWSPEALKYALLEADRVGTDWSACVDALRTRFDDLCGSLDVARWLPLSSELDVLESNIAWSSTSGPLTISITAGNRNELIRQCSSLNGTAAEVRRRPSKSWKREWSARFKASQRA